MVPIFIAEVFCPSTRDQSYKTNTVVIYCHFRLNYHSILITLNLPLNDSKLLKYFNPSKSRVEITVVNYCSKYFYNIGPI
jgi:hypothetical protein